MINLIKKNKKGFLHNDLDKVWGTPFVEEFLNHLRIHPFTAIAQHASGLWIKNEKLTPSNTFKFRGASLLFKELILKDIKNIVIASTGNHALSMSTLAQKHHVSVSAFLPIHADEEKIKKLQLLGVKVICSGENLNESIFLAKKYASDEKMIFIESIDPLLIVGYASLLWEAHVQSSVFKRLYFPIGIGSGISGQILANQHLDRKIDIVAVVHAKHKCWLESLQAGIIQAVKPSPSLAPGLMISVPDENVFQFISSYLEKIILIDDDDLIRAAKVFGFPIDHSTDLTSFASFAAALKSGDTSESTLVVIC